MRIICRTIICLIFICGFFASRAQSPTDSLLKTDPSSRWGPNDTIIVAAIIYNGERMPYSELPMVWISKLPPDKLAKVIEDYNRLRNAVYLTYPYARQAGVVINDVNAQLVGVQSKADRKKIIKSREKELKKKFTEPLSNLSVWQGKVLMKLINRETGNNCYEIIKEYRGGLEARFYQTVAFFFGSSLKQPFNYSQDPMDRQIEMFVQEINNYWTNGYNANYVKPTIRY